MTDLREEEGKEINNKPLKLTEKEAILLLREFQNKFEENDRNQKQSFVEMRLYARHHPEHAAQIEQHIKESEALTASEVDSLLDTLEKKFPHLKEEYKEEEEEEKK